MLVVCVEMGLELVVENDARDVEESLVGMKCCYCVPIGFARTSDSPTRRHSSCARPHSDERTMMLNSRVFEVQYFKLHESRLTQGPDDRRDQHYQPTINSRRARS